MGQRATTVPFDTEVAFSSPKPYTTNASITCATVSVGVACKSAAGLAVVDADHPYCKVRVKQDGGSASFKDKTPSINSFSPTWTSENNFSYSWEAEVLFEEDEEGED